MMLAGHGCRPFINGENIPDGYSLINGNLCPPGANTVKTSVTT